MLREPREGVYRRIALLAVLRPRRDPSDQGPSTKAANQWRPDIEISAQAWDSAGAVRFPTAGPLPPAGRLAGASPLLPRSADDGSGASRRGRSFWALRPAAVQNKGPPRRRRPFRCVSHSYRERANSCPRHAAAKLRPLRGSQIARVAPQALESPSPDTSSRTPPGLLGSCRGCASSPGGGGSRAGGCSGAFAGRSQSAPSRDPCGRSAAPPSVRLEASSTLSAPLRGAIGHDVSG